MEIGTVEGGVNDQSDYKAISVWKGQRAQYDRLRGLEQSSAYPLFLEESISGYGKWADEMGVYVSRLDRLLLRRAIRSSPMVEQGFRDLEEDIEALHAKEEQVFSGMDFRLLARENPAYKGIFSGAYSP